MKISAKTMQDLVDLIPRQLVGRYHRTKFPLSRFNDISSHLESYADTPYMTDEMVIPKEDGISGYLLNDRVRQVRGIYDVPIGSVIDPRHVSIAGDLTYRPDIHPDKSNPIRFDVKGNTIRMEVAPAVSEPTFTEDRSINNSTGSTTKKLFDVGESTPLDTEENLRGKAIIIQHNSGATDHLMIAENDAAEYSLRVNGEMSAVPDDDTVYSIYNNYWIMEYAIYLPRMNVAGVLTQSILIPQDFEEVYRLGMFWHYYAQEGENKAEIDRYQRLFDQEKTRFCSDQNRHRSDNFITVPRQVPSMFPSSRSG